MKLLSSLVTKPSNSQIWRQRKLKQLVLLGILFLGVLLTFVFSLIKGSVEIGLTDIVQSILLGPRPQNFGNADQGLHIIIWSIRFPRVLMSLLCGAGLAVAGTAMQGILRNPLASPYTLGISSASGFGASLAIVADFGIVSMFSIAGYLLIIINSFLFSLLALGLVLVISRTRGYRPEVMILSGIAMMYLFSAGTSLLQYLATNDQLAQIVFWLMGSLTSVTWKQLGIASIIFAAIFPVLFKLSWNLNLLSCGEELAQTMGAHPKQIMIVSAVLASILSATLVSFCGVIGFIGLVGPHLVRLILGNDHRLLFPASAMSGAILLAIADTLARTIIIPLELPIGVITSFIGVPFFISILVRKKRNYLS